MYEPDIGNNYSADKVTVRSICILGRGSRQIPISASSEYAVRKTLRYHFAPICTPICKLHFIFVFSLTRHALQCVLFNYIPLEYISC